MRELKEAIAARGVGIGTDIVKVDSFLNHRIDVPLILKMGEAFCEAFKDDRPDLILTVEASGISLAMATSQAFGGIPVVFAKKGEHRNTADDAFTAPVFSYTKGVSYEIRVSKK